MGKYTWPNPGYPESGQWGFPSPTSGGPTSWQGEIEYVKDFVRDRLDWMDRQLGYYPDGISPVTASRNVGIRAFPNPCSTETNILIHNEHTGNLILQVYSVDGQLIKLVHKENQTAGELGIMLDTHDFHNGLYLLTLQSGTHTMTLKLIVQK
jgi:hypothetical protein